MEKTVFGNLFGIVVSDTEIKGNIDSAGIYTDRQDAITDLVELIELEQGVKLTEEQRTELVDFAQLIVNDIAYTIVMF